MRCALAMLSIANQSRVKHAEGAEDLRFQELASNPLEQLRTLLQEMERYASAWPPSTLPNEEQREAEDRDRRRFADEVERFRFGVSQLEERPDAFKAFLVDYAGVRQYLESSRPKRWIGVASFSDRIRRVGNRRVMR